MEKLKKIFPWGIFFADIFFNYNGFDLIVGNPPYIRQERIGDEKRDYQKTIKYLIIRQIYIHTFLNYLTRS